MTTTNNILQLTKSQIIFDRKLTLNIKLTKYETVKASWYAVFGSLEKPCISKTVHHKIGKNPKQSAQNPCKILKIFKNPRKSKYLKCFWNQKSINLQYNMLGRLDDGTNESSTKRLMFQILFFFMISCRILCKNTFNLFVHFFKKNTKLKVKSFECPKSTNSLKKIILGTSDAWSTLRLSNWPSDPAWIYLRLTDF